MSGKTNLSAQGRAEAALWYSGGKSIYGVHKGYGKSLPVVEEELVYPADNTVTSYGNKVQFSIPSQRFDMGRDFHLAYTRSAGANTANVSGAYALDYELYSSIDKIECLYNNKVFWSKLGSQLIKDLDHKYTKEQRAGIAIMQNGQLGVVDRRRRFEKAQNLRGPLQVPWQNMSYALPTVSLTDKIIVEVTLKAANAIFRQPGYGTSGVTTTIPTLSNFNLYVDAVHLPEVHRKQIWNTMHGSSGSAVEKDFGYEILWTDWEYQLREPIIKTAASTSQVDMPATIKLPNLRSTAFMLEVELQYQVQQDDPRYLTRQTLPIRDMTLYNAGVAITTVREQNTAEDLYAAGNSGEKYYHNPIRFPHAPVGQCRHFLVFAPDELVKSAHAQTITGRTFNKLENAELRINYHNNLHVTCPYPDIGLMETGSNVYATNNALTSTHLLSMYVQVTAYVYNVVLQQGADMRSLFRIQH